MLPSFFHLQLFFWLLHGLGDADCVTSHCRKGEYAGEAHSVSEALHVSLPLLVCLVVLGEVDRLTMEA